MGESTRVTPLFQVPNYPAWFGVDTFLLCSSVVLAALNPKIRNIPASPHWSEVDL